MIKWYSQTSLSQTPWDLGKKLQVIQGFEKLRLHYIKKQWLRLSTFSTEVLTSRYWWLRVNACIFLWSTVFKSLYSISHYDCMSRDMSMRLKGNICMKTNKILHKVKRLHKGVHVYTKLTMASSITFLTGSNNFSMTAWKMKEENP